MFYDSKIVKFSSIGFDFDDKNDIEIALTHHYSNFQVTVNNNIFMWPIGFFVDSVPKLRMVVLRVLIQSNKFIMKYVFIFQ